MQDFSGKSVVVTGGLGALGGALVTTLVDRGATCYIPSRRPAPETQERPNVQIIGSIDLSDEASVVSFYENLPSLYASFHVAGGFSREPIEETTLEIFNQMYTRNAVTSFLSCREAVKQMRKTGEGGRIVNVIARPVLQPAGMSTSYDASKAAVAAMTRSLSEELASEDIFVNAVAPSIMNTPANVDAMPDADHSTWPSVESVAKAMADLGSPQNTVTRGALVPVYGLL